jgi:hypothetical protein
VLARILLNLMYRSYFRSNIPLKTRQEVDSVSGYVPVEMYLYGYQVGSDAYEH